MIAGQSWEWWIGFHAVVALLLLADSLLPGHRGKAGHAQAYAWLGTGFFVLAAAGFAAWIAFAQGRQPALEFVAGYTIETSLSIDNLFIFLVLFQGFQIGVERQHRALAWGVWGAIVLRAFFIAAGVTLLQRFHWITWGFGLFLLYAAFRLLRGGSAKAAIPEWICKLQPAKGSLLPVILAVEFTDLVFATDSIPAVLAVTHNPFVAYTSNIAAILGLRSLYFALAGLLDRFRYLHYGLGALLGFVALKMIAARWIEIPILPSLAIIAAIVTVCAVVSWIADAREAGAGNRDQGSGVSKKREGNCE
ncbi:MAG TPA: branched-chain amino acid ABC transporter substrate-binding protein [Terracidiphilus sp.]|jgi:tellurite resistance protein TerC|nr:branched-chain amino acid ABC transporter substrate-binding protein [Terracidiphilus sp.]